MAKGLESFQKVIANLQRETSKIKKNALKGATLGMIEIMNDTEKTYPKTPRDTGNLRSSRFIIHSMGKMDIRAGIEQGNKAVFKNKRGDAAELKQNHKSMISSVKKEVEKSKNPMVVGGFSAYYAAPVHEKIDEDVNWKGDQTGPKFLEYSIKRNKRKVLDIMKKEAKIR